jgi:hypothetical protein
VSLQGGPREGLGRVEGNGAIHGYTGESSRSAFSLNYQLLTINFAVGCGLED